MAPCVLFLLFFAFLFSSLSGVVSLTEPGDYAVLDEFRKGLLNPELLKWPIEDQDPCGNKWPHVFCSGSRVSQIQVQGLGLNGPLPQSFNKLSMLYNIGMQRNSFTGPLPSFSGLSGLQYAYLGYNKFDLIPLDFFDGLTSLQVIALDSNPLNESTGWVLPKALENCAQLVNFSCSECNIVGPVPEFFGGFSSLSSLRLAYNSLTGEIPASFYGSNLQSLVLNNQYGDGMSGSIHILASMPSLVTVWLHGNSFTGSIPDNITSCVSLAQLILNNNKLTGIVPVGLEAMVQLQIVKLDNNMFLGPIRALKTQNYTYSNNPFCQEVPGLPCSEVVMALLDFLSGVNYPPDLTGSWKGNDPCDNWLGVSCIDGEVSVLNLPNRNLSGFISPSLSKIDLLREIRLSRNNLSGTIPANLTILSSLKTLDLTSNNLSPPVPVFPGSVKLLVDQNPYIQNPNLQPPLPPNTPSGDFQASPSSGTSSPSNGSSPPTKSTVSSRKVGSATKMVIIGASVAALVLIALLVVLRHRLHKDDKNEAKFITPHCVVIHPRDSSHQEHMVKIAVTDNTSRSIATSELRSVGSIGTPDTHFFNSGNLVISVQVLRDVTGNFDPENEVGRGGFGVVYKGELHDGTMVAVKRMEASVISNKALNEFQSEIAVLSKVRHRNLVSLLGYSIEGSERLLVYEFMPQGALSKHLFHWKKLGMEPLSWMKRLNIALDVARGMEYLHTFAHQSFIHRDLKSSNILLDDDFRAKVADFGLVKLAPDGKNSVATRLAGTFGYLAPEYAVTGKITTKADVFSFGVVLMELITGLTALDEDRPEETRYLASWFFDVKSSKEKFKAAIDASIDLNDATLESILIIAELAGHCAAREPLQRPEMGHAVNVLAPLIEKWKPMNNDQEEYLGIDLHQPLLQMVKGWQADDDPDMSLTSLDDSKGSIPARPTGFAESFTSTDGR